MQDGNQSTASVIEAGTGEGVQIASESGIRLNIACGDNKIPGYVNIDLEPTVGPDLVADIRQGLPYEKETIDEIVFFHAIEHIEEALHPTILLEFWRLLKPGGGIYFSYPEFVRIAANYIENFQGMREFWKHTIYGLQRYPGDYHVALMNTQEFVEKLKEHGFINIEYTSEPGEPWNSVVYCEKGPLPKSYEELISSACLEN